MSDEIASTSAQDRIAVLRARSQSRVKELEQKIGRELASQPSTRTLFLLMDCSHSMDMAGPEKFEAAKRGAIKFCQQARDKDYLIGIISFSTRGVCIRDPSAYADDIESCIMRLTSGPYTNMADAILVAAEKLKSRKGLRAICLVTDGEPYVETGRDRDATLRAALSTKALGVEILAIGTDDADKAFLDQLVTSKELAVHVVREHLEAGITSMAKFLPG
jgi:Mg-chelatase subunit ChlD